LSVNYSGPAFSDAGPLSTIEAADCSLTLRRIEGPEAKELFLLCRPLNGTLDVGRQAETVYRMIAGVLADEGGNAESLVSETIFLRRLQTDLAAVRKARQRILGLGEKAPRHPAIEIEQPPLDGGASLQVSAHAVMPGKSALRAESIKAKAACECAGCALARGLRVVIGGESRFHASGLCGPGVGAYAQTLAMFGHAEDLLRQAGMDFGDVVRTWIHLRDIDRDYQDLNRARRVFFQARGIDPAPASTGIGGGPAAAGHDLCLGVYAVKGGRSASRSVMTSPTLNEAMDYGADFVRGMKIVEVNKVSLHVSGTASIDEEGRTAHVGDFDAQAGRMLVNIAALLQQQGATFSDVVSAITYVKRPADAARLREILQGAGFEGFPNAMVVAPICRPELLCEIEALAVLPV
jgi:enamine deaminase RidA (YjgF/YER057c/UK114 family)